MCAAGPVITGSFLTENEGSGGEDTCESEQVISESFHSGRLSRRSAVECAAPSFQGHLVQEVNQSGIVVPVRQHRYSALGMRFLWTYIYACVF